ILDGETIALAEDGSPHPFQVTMRRFGRKLEVGSMRGQLPLHSFFFDILRIDDQTLVGSTTEERIRALEAALPESMRIPRMITSDRAAAAEFLKSALERGHEGVMAKALDSTYDAGNRGASWLKLKGVRTLDLVVIGVE